MEKTEKSGVVQGLNQFWEHVRHRVMYGVDQCAANLLHAEKIRMTRKPHASQPKQADAPGLSTLLQPADAEVRQLIHNATELVDIWKFFLRRLKNGSPLDLLCFSILDEQGQFIRVRFLHSDGSPDSASKPDLPVICMSDIGNHLVQAYQRKDTTFSPDLRSLGDPLLALLPWTHSEASEERFGFNLFSIPFIAGNQVVAMMTLGFGEMDAFSQAKLSYVYGLRDSLAQVLWNLILREHLKYQAQMDNLTGLLSYTCFQDVLERELTRADQQASSVTLMLLDIDRIQDINRDFGHAMGDKAICHLAATVRRLIRGVDTVARFGADAIVVVLPETDRTGAAEMAQRFSDGLQVRLPDSLRTLSMSIGYATYPDDTRNRGALLKLTEQALHLAQFKGEAALSPENAETTPTGIGARSSVCVAAGEIGTLSDKTVIEVFASQVAKKYDTIHVPGVYQELLNQLEKRRGSTPPNAKPDDLMLETITSLAGALDAKDRYTRGHSQAVANYAVALAHALGMNPTEVEEIRAAGFLHDIGKIGIPESILCKDGQLNEKEWDIMKQHAVIGAQQILYPVTVLRPLIPAVECHHENWDGSGHPHGYKGEKIPLGARIIAIVDAFHALTSDRPYRKALPVGDARKILDASRGTRWDPHLLDVFFGMLSQASPRPAA